MKRIQYISRWAQNLSPDELKKIEKIANRSNESKSITGFLISINDIFFQLIEGEDKEIDDLFQNRILQDPRHTDIICLKSETAITRRAFPDWSMKFFDLRSYEDLVPDVLETMFQTLIDSRHILSKYTRPSVLDILNRGIDPTSIPAKKVKKVILMSDVFGFSLLSEKFSAETVIEIVNRYIAICSTHITSFGGEINSIMGDGIMAVFPIVYLDQAIETGINILSDLKTMRKNSPDNAPGSLIHCGIGIASGSATEGNIGSDIKKDFTVLGRPTNLASRLESLSRELNYPIIISSSVFKESSGNWEFKSLGSIDIKGKLESETIYTLKQIKPINCQKIYEKIKNFQ